MAQITAFANQSETGFAASANAQRGYVGSPPAPTRTIVGLAGRKQSGKSTLAAALVERADFHIISFASPLKAMMESLCYYGNLYSPPPDREEPIHLFGGRSMRYALQTLGTDWGRDRISKSLWVDIAMRRIEALPENARVVIDDVRFANELHAIINRGGSTFWIEANAPKDDSHISENAIQQLDCDHVIHNHNMTEEMFRDLGVEFVLSTMGLRP